VDSVGPGAAFQHYLQVGAAQERAPNEWFDADFYRTKYEDLSGGGLDDATLFMHYNLYGVFEGRSPGPMFERFDGDRYLAENPDVAAYVHANVSAFLGSTSNGAIAHFMIYGADEQRPAFDDSGQLIDPSLFF